MVLVMVEPPPVTPDPSGNSDSSGASPTKWVEAPVPVVGAKVIESDSEYLLLVAYLQSSIDGCSRPGGQESELNGSDIIVRVTLMEPPPTPWAIPCHEARAER